MPESNLMAKSVPLGRAYEIIEDGKSFGVYTIIRCLAYDMLGSLYLAQNEQTNQRETVFVFPSLVAQDRKFPGRFNEQTKKLCTLKHPNLLNFTQPLIIQNNYCLVGEAFEGVNIPDHAMLLTGSHLSIAETKSATNLPPAQVTPILEQVLAGLAYAHEAKVMHLNLSPTKILRSGIGEIKVYGYHLLEILGQELFEMLVSAGIPPLKQSSNLSFLGTTDILSPEARLRQPLEYRSDIYALGVDTHWLLTGRKPTSPYQPPSQLQPGIGLGWDAFTQRCLQRKPEARYATANAALEDLRNLAQLTPLAQKQPLELLLPPETAATPVAEKKKNNKAPAVKKSKLVKPPRHARKPLTLAQRLLFIGLPSIILVGLAAFLYVKIETSDDDLSNSDITAARAMEGQTPILRLSITPRNSIVTIGKAVFQVSDGELPLNIAKGDYTIIVESPPKYRNKRIPYTVQAQPDHLFVNLDPAWAIVDFSTAPGATVQAQPDHGPAIPLGVADTKGDLHVTQGLGDGNYTFTASKEDYTPAQLTGQKLELTKVYHFDLKTIAEPAVITLTTEPPGATVRLGDRVLGQTPFATKDFPVDTDVALSLEKQGYQTVARTLRVRPNDTETIDLGSLDAKMGNLALELQMEGRAPNAAELRDAKIIINQRDYPASTRQVPNMLEGSYSITFQHPDYIPIEQTVAIVSGKTLAVSANLQPKPTRLTIHPTPTVPITVWVNDHLLAPNADGTYALPPNQADTVRVEAQNYASAIRDFKPGPNQTLSWDASLSVLAAPKLTQDYQVPYLSLDLKWIPSGSYTMGSPGSEVGRDAAAEGPPTKVTFPVGFWAGKFEVTQTQYQAIMGENPAEFGHDAPERYPVEKVSWFQAREFTQKLTEREKAAGRLPPGYEYRLPTEAEWEYFARANTTTPFWFGDHADPSKGNFNGTYPSASGSDLATTSINRTTPVDAYPPNPWGLYDVHGNVREWVLDAFKARLPGGEVTAPGLETSDDNARRSYRGGGWGDYARDARAAWRDPGQGVRPETVSNQIGLRVVLAPAIVKAP